MTKHKSGAPDECPVWSPPGAVTEEMAGREGEPIAGGGDSRGRHPSTNLRRSPSSLRTF